MEVRPKSQSAATVIEVIDTNTLLTRHQHRLGMAGKKSSKKTEEEVVEEVVEELPVETPPVKETPKKAAKTAKKASGLPDPLDESLSTEEFVRAAYTAILKRDADEGGLRHYVRALNAGDVAFGRAELLEDLAASEEALAL